MSHVGNHVKNALQLADFAQEVPIDRKDRRVTVRLSAEFYGALLLVARRTLDSPTGAAQSLLIAALQDAVEEMGYTSLEAASQDIVKVLGTDSEESRRVDI